MKWENLKEYRLLLIIVFLFLVNLFLFNNKMININTDFGREIFFSKMISQGAVLYRDIFNTFVCPFSYLFNGLVLKFAPVNISTFYALGAVNCVIILGGIYFISKKFLSNTVSAIITAFVMYYCCFYAGLMNFLTPYSYAIVYGLSACIVSILAYLHFLKTDKKFFLYAAFLFGGLSGACKYEFCLYGLFLFAFFLIKKCDIKTFFCCCAAFFTVPLLCVIVLFSQGLDFQDISNYLAILKEFVHQPYLKKVYAITCYLNKDSIISSVRTFAAALILSGVIYKLYEKDSLTVKITRRFLWCLLTAGAFFYFPLTEYFAYCFFGFITYAVLILALLKIKTIQDNKDIYFLAGASLIISLKSFWYIATNFYGRYFIALLVISLFVILKNLYFKDVKASLVFEKTFCALLIFLSFCAFRLNLVALVLKDRIIKTPYGAIALTNKEQQLLAPAVKYITENTNPNQKVVTLGNSPLLNFLTDRNSIPFYSHYDEAIAGAYGSGRIINAYKFYKPDYITIFDSNDGSSYCKTYGKEVCQWVFSNYKKEKQTGVNEKIYIMKKF